MKKLLTIALLLFSFALSAQEVYPKMNHLLKGTAEHAQHERFVENIRNNMKLFFKSDEYKIWKKNQGIDSTYTERYIIHMTEKRIIIKFDKKLTREQLGYRKFTNKI